MRSPIRTMAGVVLAVVALTAAACGSDATNVPASGDQATPTSTSTSETTTGVFPITVSYAGADTTIEARPEAIVSLSPAATEMLFAIGAGDQVAAVDEYSDYPPEAPTSDLSGYEPNVEAIIAIDPDLVVVVADANDLIAGLDTVGIPTIVLPAATVLEDSYAEIEVLGAATGHVAEAAEVVATMQSDIDELVASVPDRPEPLTYYHELDDTLFTVTSSTFIGQIYALAGLENVADPADADGSSSGYPQLSAEFLVDADPDLIFLADTKCCGQDAATLAARPGFGDLTAVRSGSVIELDDDIASRWGPRVVDFLRAIVEATTSVETSAG